MVTHQDTAGPPRRRNVPKGVAHQRAKVGALSRDRAPDDPELVAARRDLAAEGLTEHVKRVVAEAPKLTPDQLDKICSLLRQPNTEPPDPCRNQCGALGTDEREAWAERRSCPCRSETP